MAFANMLILAEGLSDRLSQYGTTQTDVARSAAAARNVAGETNTITGHSL